MADIEAIKKLREATDAGVGDCREALEENKGDFEKAKLWLRKKGVAKAAKRAERATSEGTLGVYLHPANNKLGVIVEVQCETDFVARNEKFKEFVKDVSLQIAGMSPTYVSKHDVPKSVVTAWKKEISATSKAKKPSSQELEGRLASKYKEVCLLEQSFFKDDKTTVGEIFTNLIAVIGENMKITRFVRLRMGEPVVVAETTSKPVAEAE